jgi:hypothetical protein
MNKFQFSHVAEMLRLDFFPLCKQISRKRSGSYAQGLRHDVKSPLPSEEKGVGGHLSATVEYGSPPKRES